MSRSDPYDDDDDDRRAVAGGTRTTTTGRLAGGAGTTWRTTTATGRDRGRAAEDGMGKAAMIVGIVSLAVTLLTGLLSCLCSWASSGSGSG